MCKCIPKSLLAGPQCIQYPAARGHIEHIADPQPPSCIQVRRSPENRDAAAVLAEDFLLEEGARAPLREFFDGPLVEVNVLRPGHQPERDPGAQVLAAVLQ